MNGIIKKIYTYFEQLEEKKLRWYLIIFGMIIFLILAGIFFQYHRSVNTLRYKIDDINELRETVRSLLQQAQQVKAQRAEVDAMIAAEPNFKIGGYFRELVTQLQLTEKIKKTETSPLEREDNYREEILNAEFVDMNMKELTELLYEIEKNKRIYTKELDIVKSKKTPDAIDVTITIATLQPKSGIA